jgi:hypothetical protein
VRFRSAAGPSGPARKSTDYGTLVTVGLPSAEGATDVPLRLRSSCVNLETDKVWLTCSNSSGLEMKVRTSQSMQLCWL